MALALEQVLSLCAVAVDFVDVDLLVPACDGEQVVCRRELELGYAV